MNRQTKGYFPLEIGLKRQIPNRFMVDENIVAIILILHVHDKYIKIR